MTLKRIIFLSLLCSTVLTLVFATGGRDQTSTDTKPDLVTLKFVDFQAGNKGLQDSYEALIPFFEEENPGYTIEYQQYGAPTYNEYLKPAISSGNGPDLMAVFPGPDLSDIGKSGALRDLTNDIDAEWRKWLGASFDFSGLRYENKILIVPQDVWTEGLWYYKDLLPQVGVSLDKVSMTTALTIQEFINMIAPAKKQGMNVITAGFLEPWQVYDSFYNYVHQQQMDTSRDIVQEAFDGDISWNQEIFRNAISVFVTMNNAGVWNQDSLNQDYQVQALGKWLNRESVFIYGQADWFVGSMPKEHNSIGNSNVGFLPYPLVNEESRVVYNKNFGTDIGVYAEGNHQEVALAWAKITNSPQAAQLFVANGVNPASGLNTTSLPETDNPLFNELIALYHTPGIVSEVYYTNSEAQRVLADGIINVMLGQLTPEELLLKLNATCGYSK